MSKTQEPKLGRIHWVILSTAVLLVMGCIVFFITESLRAIDNRLDIPYEGQPWIGKEDAPVKMMEFADFKCSSCKVFHDQVYKKIKKEYIDTGKVRLYFTNFQWISEDSITAGMVGESVYQQSNEAFWKYYDAVFTNQKEAHIPWATASFLTGLIKKHVPHVDIKQIQEELKNKTYEQAVLFDNELAQRFHVDEVPMLFINGLKVPNPLDYKQIKQMIEEELQ